MEKALANSDMRKYLPELPKTHKIDKTYITAVSFQRCITMKVVNFIDAPWLDAEYRKAQQRRLEKQTNQEKAIVQLKDDIKRIYEKAYIKSCKELHVSV